MQRFLNNRPGPWLLLTAITALLTLPGLGHPSLWDIDEGNNAEAAREMLERGDWVVPTFNFELRVDKPALLYWLQILAYQLFGVSELAARLPSALAAWLAVLGTYELGRAFFGATAGLWSGLVLASSLAFCAAAHFANPDALLTACTTATFLAFWWSYQKGRLAFSLLGVWTGLAVLAKGPVGLVLPGGVLALFLLAVRRLSLLADRRLILGLATFLAVALPWYAWVGAETRAEFLRGFFLKHNFGRFLSPMENHAGPPFYYVLAILIGLTPWSVFGGLALWNSVREGRLDPGRRPAYVFLWCWVAAYVVFFSLARTKLPNYVLPAYPALALLTGQFLTRWQQGEFQPAPRILTLALVLFAAIGMVTVAGLLVAGGAVDVAALRGRRLPGLLTWAWVGVLPVLGAVLGAAFLRRGQTVPACFTLASTAVIFLGLLAGGGAAAVEACKAPRGLIGLLPAGHQQREVRIACYGYFQPSLVFYCRRQVKVLASAAEAAQFLEWPYEAYLIIPATVWDDLQRRVTVPHAVLGRRFDLYRNMDIVVVCNRPQVVTPCRGS